VASTRSTGFDWKTFWAMWDGFDGKIDYLGMMASDANHEISGDWVEQYLRDEIARRRLAHVVTAGDVPETTPRPHHHGI
jgi:hypothetical protein